MTGGAGFIGSHLVERLVEQGTAVVVLDDFSSGSRENLVAVADRIDIVEADVGAIDNLAAEIGPVDLVYHLAALISGHDSLIEPHDYLKTNVQGTQKVIDFAGRADVSRLIFASSSTIYGNQPVPHIDEARPPAPLTTYALSKLAGEHLIRLYASIHGYTHCSLRLFNVYGPRQSINHPYANVTCKFSHAAAFGERITLYGTGDQARDFVYVEDVVASFMAVQRQSPNGIYNVGTGEATSINSLIALLEGIAGVSLECNRQSAWPNDIKTISADIGALRADLGLSPAVPIAEGLRRTVEAFRNQ